MTNAYGFPEGYEPNPRETDAFVATLRRPVFGVGAHELKDSGKGKVVLLHLCLRKLLGYDLIHHQTIGDCVSQGYGLGVDILKAAEIVDKGEAEEFNSVTCTEGIYGSGRVEVGGGRLSGDGCVGAWAAKAVREYGTLGRRNYRDERGDRRLPDLRGYRGRRERE